MILKVGHSFGDCTNLRSQKSQCTGLPLAVSKEDIRQEGQKRNEQGLTGGYKSKEILLESSVSIAG